MKNRFFAIPLTLCLALALAGCGGELGSQPVTVPGSAPSSGSDLVSQALKDFDYAYQDDTQALMAAQSGLNEGGRTMLPAGPECISAQEAVNRAALWMEVFSGVDLAPYPFTTHSLRTPEYAEGERTLWYVDCWQAPEGVDEGSFHFSAYVDAITGDVVRVSTPLPVGAERTQLTRQELESAAGLLPGLFERLGLPAPTGTELPNGADLCMLAEVGDASYLVYFEGAEKRPVSILEPALWQRPE